jgi:hypothetical protein
MRLHPARLGLHCGAVTLLVSGALLLGGSPGHAATASRAESYGGEATASSFHYLVDRKPQPTPVTDAFHVEMPYATSVFDSSGTVAATSSALYPGAGPLGVPALICQFAAEPCQPPFPAIPRYPLLAAASYPTKPDDAADVGVGKQVVGPITISPNVVVAHADANRVEATAQTAGVGLTGQLGADGAVAHSKQGFDGDTLVVLSEATVSGLDLAGGMLHIDALTSVATARVDGAKITAATATTTISGATLAGQAVTIDATGIHVAGNGAALDQLNTALAALDSQGISVRLLNSTKETSGLAASAIAGGLLVSFSHEVNLPGPPIPLPPSLPGLPAYNGQYFGSVTIGGAGVRAFATPPQDLLLPPVDLSTDPDLGSPAVHVPPLGPVPPLSSTGSPPSTSTPDPTLGSGSTHTAALLGVDLSADRLTRLSLVLLGYPLLVLLTSPLTRRRRE